MWSLSKGRKWVLNGIMFLGRPQDKTIKLSQNLLPLRAKKINDFQKVIEFWLLLGES